MNTLWLTMATVIAAACCPINAIFPFKLDGVDVVVQNVKDQFGEQVLPIENHGPYAGSLQKPFVESPYGFVPQQFVNEPVCPLYVKKVWEEAVVEQVVHSLVTVWEGAQKTEFVYVTDTVKYPVTVIDRTTVTVPAKPIYKTETVIVPEDRTVMSARIDTVDVDITQTELEVITFTLTNTITTTSIEAEWITLTEYTTSFETVQVPVTSTSTVWSQQVETVTQPVYVTTNLWVEAPQLSLITSTEYIPHYMTQTTTVTSQVYTTVCPKHNYGGYH